MQFPYSASPDYFRSEGLLAAGKFIFPSPLFLVQAKDPVFSLKSFSFSDAKLLLHISFTIWEVSLVYPLRKGIDSH